MERRLVYDSDAVQPGRCLTCGKRLDRCSCGPRSRRPAELPSSKQLNLPRDGIVRILRDKKGRGGKAVTVVAGVPGSEATLSALLSELKRQCGTGGTLRGDLLEFQGDVRARLQTELEKRGFKVKLAGG